VSSPPPPSFSSRYCAFVARRAKRILAIGLLVMIGAVALASRLELHTAFSELLPSDDPGVVALHKTQERMGDLSLLLVGVRSPDRAANLRFAEALTEKLRALPPSICALATYHLRDLKAFFQRNKWLYVSEDDLTTIRDRLRKEIGKRKNPLLMDLGGDDEPIDALKQRLTGGDKLGGKFPDGVFSNKEGTYVWIAALPPGGLFGEHAGEDLFRAAKQILASGDATSYHPEMTAYVAGPVATLIANRQAVERDIVWVTLTCVGVVGLSIAAFFRRWRAVPLIGLPAVLGTVLAFAVAELAFGYVNSSTAFLGSIILGNGINYAIILMSRYQEQRAAGDSPDDALERALAGVVRGTGGAAICASAAYASLMMTSFRGFYQFGVMGAVGVLFCWLSTFTVLPALIHVIDRHAPGERGRRAPLSLSGLGRLLTRRSSALLGAATVMTVVASYGLFHFAEDPFEYDFRKLKARIAETDADREFGDSQESLFGRWPSPTIILADKTSEVESVRAAIHRQDVAQRVKSGKSGKEVIGQILTVFDILPGTPEAQQRKIALLANIRKLRNDPGLDLVDDKEKKQLEALDIPEELHVLQPADLPALARRPFTEADGTLGRVVLVYPVERGLSVWNGRDLLRIQKVLQRLELVDEHKTLETSGPAVVFGAMIQSILKDGPRATLASLVAVMLLILFTMRPFKTAAMTMATLLVGVIWMAGAAGWNEVKITFLNFIALPITFGIGAEYAINVVTRNQEGRDMVRAVMSTGSAVALCSWTTIVGYGSLLAARNRALQGFGAMAILGEVACLLAAIVALPSLVLWLRTRNQLPGAAAPARSSRAS
jgi:predicted RND superfamily exporter protein